MRRNVCQDIPKTHPDVIIAIEQKVRMILFGICAKMVENVSYRIDSYHSRRWTSVKARALTIVSHRTCGYLSNKSTLNAPYARFTLSIKYTGRRANVEAHLPDMMITVLQCTKLNLLPSVQCR